MVRNLGRFTFHVLSGCWLLAVSAFTLHAQSLTFAAFAGPAGGPGSADGTGSAARFNRPIGVATDSAGNVYVADSGNNTIRKITPAGIVTTPAGLAGLGGSADGTGSDARFNRPTGVATDKDGNVYVADLGNNTIRKITPAGVVTTVAGLADRQGFGSDDGAGSDARFSSPSGVATDSTGNIYVADSGNNEIRKITPTRVVTTVAGSAGLKGNVDGASSAARFSNTLGVAADSSGNVYVADTNNRTIRKITPSGVVTTLAGSAGKRGSWDGTGSAARFMLPFGVATDRNGNVYVADETTIRTITPEGVVTTLAGPLKEWGDRTGSPQGLATDKDGNVYVADSTVHTILKVTPAGVVTTLAGSPPLSGSTDGTGSAARFIRPETPLVSRRPGLPGGA